MDSAHVAAFPELSAFGTFRVSQKNTFIHIEDDEDDAPVRKCRSDHPRTPLSDSQKGPCLDAPSPVRERSLSDAAALRGSAPQGGASKVGGVGAVGTPASPQRQHHQKMLCAPVEDPTARSPSASSTRSTRASTWGGSPVQEAPRSAWADLADEEEPQDADPILTTVMLRNLPEVFGRVAVLNLLRREGFTDSFNFLYVPQKLGMEYNFGYLFINFVTHEHALQFKKHFQGFTRWTVSTDKVADIQWGETQGVDALVGRYRNSPIMHGSVPDEMKPALFAKGRRAAFPRPTKTLKPMRTRARTTSQQA